MQFHLLFRLHPAGQAAQPVQGLLLAVVLAVQVWRFVPVRLAVILQAVIEIAAPKEIFPAFARRQDQAAFFARFQHHQAKKQGPLGKLKQAFRLRYLVPERIQPLPIEMAFELLRRDVLQNRGIAEG